MRDLYEFEGEGTGFSFNDFNSSALKMTVERAVTVFRETDVWKKMRLRGMRQDFSWEISAEKYGQVYRHVTYKPSTS